MPKRHQQNFTKPSSSYVHPSLQVSKALAATDAAPNRSVNERLSQLRREQAPKADVARRNEVAAVVSQRTVPPALRQIMNIPETAPPKPKPGTSNRVRGRRPPGPAAPQSWLESSRHAPPSAKKSDMGRDTGPRCSTTAGWRPHGSSALSKLCNNSSSGTVSKRSLIHQALKTMAVNWDWLLEYEQLNLATLPVPLKSSLLSYIARYGPDEGIRISTLKLLFLASEELPDGTGSEEVKQLDFSGLINRDFTVVDLNKYFNRAPGHVTEALQKLSAAELLDPNYRLETIASKMKHKAVVVDSWEEELDGSGRLSLSKSLSTSRFPNLTHLSLSHPGAAASWAHLLSFSTRLATLTHLSLAYWPMPSMTPNSKTAAVYGRYAGPVALGGSHFYSAMDDDWDEAANILRRFSNNTYCLKWLDLQGCNDWLPALTANAPSSKEWMFDVDGMPPPDTHTGSTGPDWRGSWSQIEYVNISQGWVPGGVEAIRRLPSNKLARELLEYLQDEEDPRMPRETPHVEGDVRHWMERERRGRNVEEAVKDLRRSARGRYCRFDHGWGDSTDLRAVDSDDELEGWVETSEL